MGVEGKIFVQFIINNDGTISDVIAINELGSGVEQEAIRIVANSPACNQGRQRGKPVKQRMVIPIFFKLAP